MWKTAIVAAAIAVVVGCTTAQQGAVVGGAAGAGAGAIIGNQVGHPGTGALIGAGAGATGGALVGEQLETMFCPRCGKRYRSSYSYCTVDGTPLQPIRR